MATHLDLEEQEQLDQLKHFWNQWGNLITWVLIAALAAYAGWNGWQYWQRNQAAQAAMMYDELERSAAGGDVARIDRAWGDMQSKFGGTTYAAQGGLLAAKALADKGEADKAKAALTWVADKAGDSGLQAVARLRLASLQVGAKQYDEALKTLGASVPTEFAPLVADRRGDVYLLQNKRAEAVTEFGKAYQGLEGSGDYRRIVGIKLNSLGVDPDAGAKPAAATVAQGAAK